MSDKRYSEERYDGSTKVICHEGKSPECEIHAPGLGTLICNHRGGRIHNGMVVKGCH